MATDDDLRAEWRSWLDKDEMPPGWERNLWDEFYVLHHRRDQWRAFRTMFNRSPEDARETARWFVHWVTRNYVEAQTAALRRFAYAGPDQRPISFGKVLAGIADRPSMFGADVSRDAATDLATMTIHVAAVDTFADKYVAHLDRDHATAVPPLTFIEMGRALDFISPLWGRWYLVVTGKGAMNETIPEDGWAAFLRFHREPGPHERFLEGWRRGDALSSGEDQDHQS